MTAHILRGLRLLNLGLSRFVTRTAATECVVCFFYASKKEPNPDIATYKTTRSIDVSSVMKMDEAQYVQNYCM